jgi:hypothetical protein
MGGRSARRPGKTARSHVHRTIRCHLLLMCQQQGRTGGIAARLYVDSGLGGVSGHDDGERRRRGRQSVDDPDRAAAGSGATAAVGVVAARVVCDRRVIARGTMCRGRRIRSRWCMRSDGSGVDSAAFAPSRSRLPIRRRGSPGACGNRSGWTVSRCRPRMRPSATASVGGKPVERSTRFCATGTASVLDAVPGISAPTRFTAVRRRSSTPCSRTSCTAK